MSTPTNPTKSTTATSTAACPACGRTNRVPVASTGRVRCGACHADLPWLVHADDASFDAAVATDQLVLVDLWAPWCGPCRMIAPVLDKLAVDLAGRLKIVKVDVDTSPAIAQRFRATSIPMLQVLRQGRVVDTIVGAQPEHVLRARLAPLLAG